MLRLFVLRHAKAAIASPGMKDFDRGLSERGMRDGAKLAKLMQRRGYLPHSIIVSPSRRTKMTLHCIIQAYSDEAAPKIDYDENLYFGEADSYLSAARSFGSSVSGMLIGHNPMCEVFTSSLAATGTDAARKALQEKFPTCALAVFEVESDDWQSLGPASAYLADFIVADDH